MTPDINYDEVFGISSEGEKVQEVADPVAEDSAETEGEKAQEAADPVADEQTPEDNARFAAARRRAEQEAALKIERAKQAAAKELDTAIAQLGITNPYTNSTIRTKAEYDAYIERKRVEQEASIRSASGMSDEEFENYKNSLPEVIAAREALANVEKRESEQRISEELSKINGFDPTVKTLEDIASSPVFHDVLEKTKRGYTLSDAWRLANMDRLSLKTVEKTKQAAINSYNGKNHLTPTTPRGEGMVDVPADVAAMYRAFNPNATPAEIQRHYNKNL